MKILLNGLLVLLLCSCGTFSKVSKLDTQTNYFPARQNHIPKVLINKTVNYDSLKNILVVLLDDDYWFKMGKNLEYFDSVMSVEHFKVSLKQAGLSDKVPIQFDPANFHTLYDLYQPFVMLDLTKVRKGDDWYAGLVLYDPGRSEIIFQNEIWLNLRWDGWTDQGTMYPLFNSLLDYLRKQKNK